MATRIGVLSEGELLQVGSPRDVYEQPNCIYVAARLGSPQINLMPAELLPGLAMPKGASTVGVRTEHLRISASGGAGVPARVHRVEHLGDQNHLHIKINEHEVVTLVDPDAELTIGDEVGIVLEAPLFFDGNGARLAATC